MTKVTNWSGLASINEPPSAHTNDHSSKDKAVQPVDTDGMSLHVSSPDRLAAPNTMQKNT